jgi:hypothetical protein
MPNSQYLKTAKWARTSRKCQVLGSRIDHECSIERRQIETLGMLRAEKKFIESFCMLAIALVGRVSDTACVAEIWPVPRIPADCKRNLWRLGT